MLSFALRQYLDCVSIMVNQHLGKNIPTPGWPDWKTSCKIPILPTTMKTFSRTKKLPLHFVFIKVFIRVRRILEKCFTSGTKYMKHITGMKIWHILSKWRWNHFMGFQNDLLSIGYRSLTCLPTWGRFNLAIIIHTNLWSPFDYVLSSWIFSHHIKLLLSHRDPIWTPDIF